MPTLDNQFRSNTRRLRNWNYTSAGWYFVTICTHNRGRYFGEVKYAAMRPSEIGRVAEEFWKGIPDHSPGKIYLDSYVIMPDHIHGIIAIAARPLPPVVETPSKTLQTMSLKAHYSAISPKAGSLGAVIRSYKSAVTRWCSQNNRPFQWQARYFDRIIRNDQALDRIRRYIANNPAQWAEDRNTTPDLWM